MTEQEMHDWIDNATYRQLLRRHRFFPVGDPFFMGAVGEHFMKAMSKRKAEDPAEAVAASKAIGWEQP